MNSRLPPQPAHVTPLADRLWGRRTRRSTELTPLYVQRHVGPRLGSEDMPHAFAELTYCISGRGSLRSTTTTAMRPHRAILVVAGVAHHEHATEDIETMWVGLRGSLVDSLPRQTILTLDEPALTPVVESLWEASQSSHAGTGMECDSLMRLILARILRQQDAGVAPDMVSRALEIMHERLHDPVTVSYLSGELDCSEGYLHRSFKLQTGETPVQCLTRLRMERAMNLIRQTRLSLKQIAARVGYADPLYFSRVFRRHHGRPPRDAAREVR